MPLVSIILLNFNGAKYSNLWKSLFYLDYPNYEIIFVDNGSSDNSDELFKKMVYKHSDKKRIKIEIIKLEKNVGYSKANNIGIKKAKGEYIVLLSNDIEVDRYWLKNMINFLEKNKDVGIAQPIMFNYFERDKYDITFGFMNVIGNIFSSIDVIPEHLLKNPFEVFFCEGASMFIKREVIQKVGYLFDEDYFMYYEDVDFCWRARKIGYKSYVVPTSVIYHIRSGTINKKKIDVNFYQSLFIRNKLITLFRNYTPVESIKYIPISLIFTLFEAMINIVLYKNPRNCLNIINGILAFFRQIPKEIRKKRLQEPREKNLIIPLSKSFRLMKKKFKSKIKV
ncbi:MAG: glycosyltransferase family 2 protein [Candidatus Aenigmatarchaeota archaeon]